MSLTSWLKNRRLFNLQEELVGREAELGELTRMETLVRHSEGTWPGHLIGKQLTLKREIAMLKFRIKNI